MYILKRIAILLTVIIVSMYYFPFNPIFLPAGLNTKMLMAAIGLPFLAISLTQERDNALTRNFLTLSAYAVAVSLIGYAAITISNTPDTSYVSYIVSMWVWISGAYVVISLIRLIHGEASLVLLCNYVITVCVAQCALALAIDQNTSVMLFVEKIQGHQDFLLEVNRLYGIGATLDTAGIRFSVAEVMIAYVLTNIDATRYRRYMPLYIIAFIFLVVVGNMMARTTSVGAVLAIVYLCIASQTSDVFRKSKYRTLLWIVALIAVAVPIATYFYNSNEAIHKSMRFGFEGFFNYFETGEWKISSNETLKGMIVFPETLKTWIIGDGYFVNPAYSDPYYTGEITIGYYKNTDIGYLRFIFYFGVIGLLAFATFILKSGLIAMDKFPKSKLFILFLLAVNYICWTKVATDIFLVFAMLYMIGGEENELYEKRIAADTEDTDEE